MAQGWLHGHVTRVVVPGPKLRKASHWSLMLCGHHLETLNHFTFEFTLRT